MRKLNHKTNKEKQKTLNNFKSNTMKKLPLLKTTTWLILSITCLLINTINAQNIIPQGSSINVFGTSNVHDWEIKATTITGEINLVVSLKISDIVQSLCLNLFALYCFSKRIFCNLRLL